MKKRIYNFLPIITLIVIYFLWLVSANAINMTLILPSPKETFFYFIKIIKQKNFWFSSLNTLLRTVYAFVLAFIPSIIIGYFAQKNKLIDRLFYPFVVILRAIPTMSIIILCLIWLSEDYSPMAVAFLVMFPMLYTSFYQAFSGVDKKLLEMSKIYNVRKRDVIFSLFIPSVAIDMYPRIINLLSFNVKLIVAGEALAYTYLSVGGSMQFENLSLNTAGVFAYTLVAIFLSFVMELLVKLVAFTVKKVRERL